MRDPRLSIYFALRMIVLTIMILLGLGWFKPEGLPDTDKVRAIFLFAALVTVVLEIVAWVRRP